MLGGKMIKSEKGDTVPEGWGAVCFALMRIAIGWHFLYEGLWKLMQPDCWSCVSYLGAAQGPLAPIFKWMASHGWIVAMGDWTVMLGLTAIGLFLMSGVLSRMAAVFGIAFMAMFYCCQPPEPFAEAFSGADGRFFVLERNMIEAVALALVALTPCRRGSLRTLLPGVFALAAFAGCFLLQYRSGALDKVEAVTSATVKVHEFTELAGLKAKFPERTSVGGVGISRLALGGDLIAGHAHARDLIWTDEFMRRYNSGATLPRMVRYCLHCGIDAAFVESEFISPMLAAAKDVGGDLKLFANCADANDAAFAAKGGAKAVYLRPETADALAGKGDADSLKALFAGLKAAGLPVGIGAEDVATVKFCAEAGIAPDFWVLAYHSLEYPAARMKTRCNNIWCVDPPAAAAYMKTRPEPWVAIRCLAGGAVDPAKAYAFAVDGGASAAAIDLLDYRIVETVNAIVSPEKPKDGKAGGEGKKEAKK